MSFTPKENTRGGTRTMLSSIRKRMTYANVVMTLALVFAMTGGAYAAKKYLITSTKQISPSVLKSLVGKAGKTGPAGPAGVAGVAGAQGPAGPAGAKGETGPEGKEGPQGKEGKAGKDGKEGSPWTAGGTLPSEATETGVWGFSAVHAPPSSFGQEVLPISFPIQLESGLNATHVHIAPDPACTGSAASPTATSGNLCVYIGFEFLGVGTAFAASIQNVKHEAGASKSGALVLAEYEGTPEVGGSWAVTAE
jgi:hypothetical protein